MALSDLGTRAEAIEGRIMNVFIDDAGSYVDFGVVKNVSINFSPVTAEGDVAGREKQLAVDVEVSFMMEQTAAKEFTAVKDVVNATGNGHTIRCTEEPSTAANAGSASAFEFVNVLPNVGGEINGSGEGSNFEVTFNGRVPVSELDGVPGSSSQITFNA